MRRLFPEEPVFTELEDLPLAQLQLRYLEITPLGCDPTGLGRDHVTMAQEYHPYNPRGKADIEVAAVEVRDVIMNPEECRVPVVADDVA